MGERKEEAGLLHPEYKMKATGVDHILSYRCDNAGQVLW